MHGIAAHNLTDRFAWLFDGLCKAIGVDALRRGMEAALAWVVWNRVRLLGERLITLAARVQAGRLPSNRLRKCPHPSPPPQERERGERSAAARAAVAGLPTARLPGGFGWIRNVLPETAQFARLIQYMLRDPE